MALTQNEIRIILTALDQASPVLNKVAAEAKSTGGAIQQGLTIGASFSATNAALQGIGQVFGAVKSTVIDFNSQLQSAQYAFTALLGSSQQAGAFLQQLQQFAATTPFEFPDVLRGAQRFLGMGMAAEQVLPLLKDISTTVAAMGGTSVQVNEVTLAIAQMSARGKVSAQEMNQLANAGVQGWSLLAEALGLPIGQVMKLAEEGQISADVFIDAMHRAANTPEMQALAENMGRSWSAATSNMLDGVRMLISGGTKPLFDELTKLVNAIGDWLTKSDEAKQLQVALATAALALVSILRPLAEQALAVGRAFLTWASALPGVQGVVAAFSSVSGGGIAQAATQTAEASARLEQARASAAAVKEELLQLPKQAIELSNALKSNETELKANEQAIKANAGALRDVKAAAEAVKQSYDDQLDALHRQQAGIEAQQKAVKQQADDIKSAFSDIRAPIETALSGVQSDLRANKQLADDVRAAYAAQIDPLEKGAAALRNQNEYANKQLELENRIRDARLGLSELAAKGDPVQAATLQAQRDILAHNKELLDIQIRQRQNSDAERGKKAADDKTLEDLKNQALALDNQDLALRAKQLGLIDASALAEVNKQQAINKANDAQANLNKTIDQSQRDLAALPLEAAAAALKQQEQQRLTLLSQQQSALQRQADMYRDMLDALKQAEADALKPLEVQAQALAKAHDDIAAKIASVKQAAEDALKPYEAQERAIQKAGDALKDEHDRLSGIKTDLQAQQAALEKHQQNLQAAATEYERIAKAASQVTASTEQITEPSAGVQQMAQAMGDLANNLAPVAVGLVAYQAGMTGAAVATALMAGAISPITLAMIALGAVAAVFTAAWIGNWGGIQDKTAAVVNWLTTTAWPAIQSAAATVMSFYESQVYPRFQELAEWLQPRLQAAWTWLTTVAWPAIQQRAQVVVDWYTGTVFPMFQDFASWLQEKIQGAWTWFTETALPALQQKAQPVIDWYNNSAFKMFAELAMWMTSGTQPSFETFQAAWQTNKSVADDFAQWWSTTGSKTFDEMSAAVGESGLAKAFKDLAATLEPVDKWLRDIAAILNAIKDPIAAIDAIQSRRQGPGGVGSVPFVPGVPADVARQMGEVYGLDPNLFVAQLQQESGLDPYTPPSSAGARGIAQFMPATAQHAADLIGVSIQQFWDDWRLQVQGAAAYMSELTTQFGDQVRALSAYYAGPGGGVHPDYVAAVQSHLAGVQRGGGNLLGPITTSQFDLGLDAATAAAACGPYAAMLFANAVGRYPTAQEAVELAKTVGWTTAGMAGPASEMELLGKMGIAAVSRAATPGNIDAAMAAGLPTMISTPGHYFVARGGTAEGGLDVGATGTVFGKDKGVLTLDQISQLGGGLQEIIVLSGSAAGALARVAQPVAALAPRMSAAALSAQQFAAQQQALDQMLSAGVQPAQQASVAIQQIQRVLPPLNQSVAEGSISMRDLQTDLIKLAASSGLATKPLEDLQAGIGNAQDDIEALAASLKDVSPQFNELYQQFRDGKISTDQLTLGLLKLLTDFGKVPAAANTAADALNKVGDIIDPNAPGQKQPGAGQPSPLLAPFTRLPNDITALTPQVQSAVEQLSSTLNSALDAEAQAANKAAIEIGAAIDRGIASGIDENLDVIKEAAKSAAQAALEAAQSELHASPVSRRALTDVGLPFSRGVAAGIREGEPGIRSAASSILGGILQSPRGASYGGSGGGAGPLIETLLVHAPGTNPGDVKAMVREVLWELDSELTALRRMNRR